MRGKSTVLMIAAALAALLFPSGPALADRIDGNWCFVDGRHFTIDGPNIVTPGGAAMKGLYDRHGFDYTVPAGEADAGAEVTMTQFDEHTVQVTTMPPGGAGRTEIWKRCDLTT